MPHPLRTDLVIPDSKSVKTFSHARRNHWLKMIILIKTAVAREREYSFFGKQVVELKLSNLDVQPAAAQQIVESSPNRFKVKCSRVIRSRQEIEAKVLGQGPGGMKIQSTPIEAMGGDPLFNGGRHASDYRAVHAYAVGRFAVPLRRHSESHGPISGALEDGGIAVIPHLVAVILERLPERA